MSKKHNGNGFIKYRSYLFVDQDPIIDALRGPVSSSKLSYGKIAQEGGPSPTTLYNWFNGTTKRPQFATVAATVRTLGKSGIKFAHNSGNPHLID